MSIEALDSLQLPLSPYDEGLTTGLTTWGTDEDVMHFDGRDHFSCTIPEDVHDDLAERPDFLQGFMAGIDIRRKLHSKGYVTFKIETPEELLGNINGGQQ